jgi:hypothetical protein
MIVQTLKIGKREFVFLPKRDFERLAALARRQNEQDQQDAATWPKAAAGGRSPAGAP